MNEKLEQIYNDILERFPAGRHASYILGNKTKDIEVVKKDLKHISEGHDSDRRYTDEQSKQDALDLLKRIEDIEKNW